MKNEITITAASPRVTVIDIEGVIGVAEEEQFPDHGAKVATYGKFKEVMEKIAAIESREIVVNIRSTGGSVGDALLIYDTLAALPAKITTRCWGYVASAATIIAQAASKGRRQMSANALYLIHRSQSAAKGNADQLSQTIDLLGKTDQRIASIYAGRSGKDTRKFIELMSENNGNGRWLSPQEALEASLVDKIIAPSQVENMACTEAILHGLPPVPAGLCELQTTENQTKHKKMTIAEKWNAIVQIIAQGNEPLDADGEVALGAEDARSMEVEELRNNVAEGVAQIELLQNTVCELSSQIEKLQSQNTRLKAKATPVKAREDASLADPKLSANQEAYMADIQKFR